MPLLFWILTCFLLVFSKNFIKGALPEAATISWRPYSNADNLTQVQFTYQSAWRVSTGPCGHGCSQDKIGLLTNNSVGKWKCSSGCSTLETLADHKYILTSFGRLSFLESGTASFLHNFSSPGQYAVGIQDDLIGWSIFTKLDLGIRNDTGQANTSPYTSIQGSLGGIYGCDYSTKLKFRDPDGDVIKCRWAENNYLKPSAHSSDLASCDFESSCSGWLNDNITDTADWQDSQSSPAVASTLSAYSGRHYKFAQPRSSQFARFLGPQYNPSYGETCLRFWYSMFSNKTGRLTVGTIILQPFSINEIWVKDGGPNMSEKWSQGMVSINGSQVMHIVFDARLGTIALDHVTLVNSSCPADPAECENQVNLSQNKTTWQVSTFNNSSSLLAVDANTNTLHASGVCASTDITDNPWFIVDLGNMYSILYVEIFGRGDVFAAKNNRFELRVASTYDGNEPDLSDFTPCYKNTVAFPTNGSPLTASCIKTARFVMMRLLTRDYLTICELNVIGYNCGERFNCDFDSYCPSGWLNSANDNFNWQIGHWTTPNDNTGPSSVQDWYTNISPLTMGSYFLYTDCKYPRLPGEKAVYLGPTIYIEAAKCVKFWYHMYGSGMGTLNVYLNGSSNASLVWTKVGQQQMSQTSPWRMAQVDITTLGYISISFEGICGTSNTSDIAIDGIVMYDGQCEITSILPEVDECGISCYGLQYTPPPNVVLTEDCSISFPNLTTENGYKVGSWYPIAIQAEDYPKTPIEIDGSLRPTNLPLSSTPLQFWLKVTTSTRPVSCTSSGCGGQPHFLYQSTLSTTDYLLVGHTLSKKVCASSFNGSEIEDITVSSPDGILLTQPLTKTLIPYERCLAYAWTPTEQQIREHFLCYAAVDNWKRTSYLCGSVVVLPVPVPVIVPSHNVSLNLYLLIRSHNGNPPVFVDQMNIHSSETFTKWQELICNASREALDETYKKSLTACWVVKFSRGSVAAQVRLVFQITQANPSLIEQQILKNWNNSLPGILLSYADVTDYDECAVGTDNDCSRYANCTNAFGTYHCHCYYGYEDKSILLGRANGTSCSLPCTDSTCKNNGACNEVLDGKPSCTCVGSAYGTWCESTPSTSQMTENDTLLSVSLVTFIFVFTVVFLFVMWLVWHQRYHPKHSHPSHHDDDSSLHSIENHPHYQYVKKLVDSMGMASPWGVHKPFSIPRFKTVYDVNTLY